MSDLDAARNRKREARLVCKALGITPTFDKQFPDEPHFTAGPHQFSAEAEGWSDRTEDLFGLLSRLQKLETGRTKALIDCGLVKLEDLLPKPNSEHLD